VRPLRRGWSRAREIVGQRARHASKKVAVLAKQQSAWAALLARAVRAAADAAVATRLRVERVDAARSPAVARRILGGAPSMDSKKARQAHGKVPSEMTPKKSHLRTLLGT
jgi:hypothetical protein